MSYFLLCFFLLRKNRNRFFFNFVPLLAATSETGAGVGVDDWVTAFWTGIGSCIGFEELEVDLDLRFKSNDLLDFIVMTC
jgi:hypothetical protein